MVVKASAKPSQRKVTREGRWRRSGAGTDSAIDIELVEDSGTVTKHERSTPISRAPRRRQAVEALRARLQRANWPRLQMSAITALTGASGFLASWLLLQLGVHRMALRYGLAVLAAYGVFLLLLRVWIHFHQRSLRRDLAGDVAEAVADAALDAVIDGGFQVGTRGAGELVRGLRPGGGSSGGAGASTAFEAPATPPAPSALLSTGGRSTSGHSTGGGSGKAGFDLSNLVPDLDLDEAIVLVVALAIAFSVLAASIWLVVGAPTLLAELLVDSALAGGLYRKLRQDDTSWLETALKKTVLPFVVVLVVAAIGGGVIQHYVPEAHSVGDVFRGEQTKP